MAQFGRVDMLYLWKVSRADTQKEAVVSKFAGFFARKKRRKAFILNDSA